MVIISMSFTVRPEAEAAFARAWREVFMPAVAARPGFVQCHLLKAWPMDDAITDQSSRRIDLSFSDEDLRRQWVDSTEHDSAFGQLAAHAEHFSVSRHLVDETS
jgi:heme-degrading monooxygenase HmoA